MVAETLTNPHTEKLAIAHAGLLLALMMLPSVVPTLSGWPIRVFAPITLYAVIVAAVPALRASVRWLRLGRIDAASACFAAWIAIASASALLLWAFTSHPDLRVFAARIPSATCSFLILYGAGFATINATIEEACWRGVILDALATKWNLRASVIIQALAFGVGHSHGIPGGLSGMALATIFGYAQGTLRICSNGLLLCVLTHMVVDATIFCLVLRAT